ncbi:ribosome recycling factor [Candidatus Gromoviella agglomerans]|uniref:ribosome recycling factor n=1 Tax=Candidatus Gromoviella agglomerans TaxID=2806609 RepID=UPI001E644738|nr:ribosome recycling factor [Candidatus Gromoviella agglomerans]UFX98455.1 Ribosome-recycling factor [Candidatus Gromoviella agglomerans]
MFSDIKNRTDNGMNKCFEHFREELSKLRSNRASIGMVDSIKFKDSYGGETMIKHSANLSSSDMSITIQPWDPKNIPAISKAIIDANIGLTPNSSATSILIQIPKLTVDKVKDIVKRANVLAEEAKISIRKIRQESIDVIKKLKQNKSISQDDEKRFSAEIQKITDHYSKNVEDLLKHKEIELSNL